MKYLLDTDVMIDHLRGKKEIPEKILQSGAGLSIISYGELIFGAEKSKRPEKTRSILTHFFTSLSLKIIPLNEDSMHEFATIKAKLERLGMGLDSFDLLIAATAKQYSLILVTRNTRHFDRIAELTLYE